MPWFFHIHHALLGFTLTLLHDINKHKGNRMLWREESQGTLTLVLWYLTGQREKDGSNPKNDF